MLTQAGAALEFYGVRNRRMVLVSLEGRGTTTYMSGLPVYQDLPKLLQGIYRMAYCRCFDLPSDVISFPMPSQSVQNRQVISRGRAILAECRLTAELSRALVCCSIANWRDEKLPYLIIAERTSAKFIKLHAQGEIVESEFILKLMLLLEEALGGTANILFPSMSPNLRTSSSKSRK